MKRGKHFRCHICHKVIDTVSNFCKFCGAKIRTLKRGVRKCPNCKKEVEDFSTYCRHCGANLIRSPKKTGAQILTYILLVLLLLVALFIFYTSLSKLGPPEKLETKLEPKAEIVSTTCNWETNSFRICQTSSWEGGSYAKGYIPGGEDLEISPRQYNDFFVYCQRIGNEEGFRVVRTIIYDEQNNILKDIGSGVECRPTRVPVESRIYNFNNYGWFTAERTTRYSDGSGTVVLEFPDEVVSCQINGTYRINDDPRARLRQYCDRATGVFDGYADVFRQYVTSDPNFFIWDGKIKQDPLPTMHDGYSIYLNTCDNLFYQKRRYYVHAKLSGFRSKILKLDWVYKDEANKPKVDVFFNLNCQLKE